MSEKHGINVNYLESLLGAEEIEDAVQMSLLDEADSFLDSEAHALAEQEIMAEYEGEHGSMDGYEDMLEDKLLSGMQQEESADIFMYSRIQERLDRVQSPEARNKLLARFAPEIMHGRDRSIRLLARLERKLAKARELDIKRNTMKRGRISLKPKQKDKERVHPGREKESTSGGYPY